MAKFVYDERGEHPVVALQAEAWEELPAEMVAAYAALRQAYALDAIADRLVGIDNAINGLKAD